MKIKKISILLILLLGLSFSTVFFAGVVAEDPQTSQIVELTFWYTENDAEKPMVLQKIAWFEGVYPNISITAEQKGFFDVGNEYETAFVAGQEPEVLRSPRDDVTRFASQNMIQPVTDEYTPADVADFVEASLKLVTYDGEYWGFPQSIDCPMYMFNKEIFNNSGLDPNFINWSTSWTWSEFETNIDLLNQTADYALSLAGMFFGAQPYYYGQGGYFMYNDTYARANIAINNTVNRDALQYLKDLVDSTYTPPWTEQGWANFVGDFGSGELAMIANGPWQIQDLITNHPQFNGTTYGPENLGFMQLPHDASDNYGSIVGGNYYVVSSQVTPAEYEAAVTFMKWMSGHTAMSQSAIENAHVPARKSVMTNASVMAAPSYEYVKPYYEQALNAIQLTPSEYYGRLESAFGNELDEYLTGDITLDELIENTIALWYDILPAPQVPPPEIPGYEVPIIIGIILSATLGIGLYTIKKKKKL